MSEHPSGETAPAGQNQTTSSTKAAERVSSKSQKRRELKSQSEVVESKDAHTLITTANASNVRATDLLHDLKLATGIGVKEKIEIARLELERERLEVEKAKALSDQRFWVKNFGTSITAIVSLAAVLVSLSQVWVASIQKDKELAVAQSQKDKEIDVARTQKEKELTSLIAQQERAWKLDMAKFVLEHRDKLLGKDKAQRELITRVMLTTFPPEYSAEIVDRLDAVADSLEVKQELRNIRTTILPKIKENRDLEQAAANKNAVNRKSPGAAWWRFLLNWREPLRYDYGGGIRPGDGGGYGGEYLKDLSEPTPSPSITPTATPHDSCRCPLPFEGGIDCWGWDDAAFCRVIGGKCEARCVTARSG